MDRPTITIEWPGGVDPRKKCNDFLWQSPVPTPAEVYTQLTIQQDIARYARQYLESQERLVESWRHVLQDAVSYQTNLRAAIDEELAALNAPAE